MPSCTAPCNFRNGLLDVRIGAASAKIAAHALAQFHVARMRRCREVWRDVTGDACCDFIEHSYSRTDLSRRAVAALIAVVLHESGLHGMQLPWRAESFDGGDLVARVHHRQGET